jgi:hypothetical protein
LEDLEGYEKELNIIMKYSLIRLESIRKVGTSKYQMNEIDEDSSNVSKPETERCKKLSG